MKNFWKGCVVFAVLLLLVAFTLDAFGQQKSLDKCTPPVPVCKANPTSGPAPLTVTFDGTGSWDPDHGTIVEWLWKFPDGTTKSGSVVYYTFNAPGTYLVQLQVKNKAGYKSLDSQGKCIVITVTEQKFPPIPICKASPTSGTAPLTVQFDGTSSYDPDGGAITQYTWDIAGSIKSGSQVEAIFTKAGTYNVHLQVKDDEGTWSDEAQGDCVKITVDDPRPKYPPVPKCVIISGGGSGIVPHTVEVDGSESFDPDGPFIGNKGIVSWKWNFKDPYNVAGSIIWGKAAQYTYKFPGTYVIELTVVDDEGVEKTGWCETVVVSDEPQNCYPEKEDLLYFRATEYRWYKINGVWHADVLIEWRLKIPRPQGENWDGVFSLRGRGYNRPEAKPTPIRPLEMDELERLKADEGKLVIDQKTNQRYLSFKIFLTKVAKNSDKNYVLLYFCGGCQIGTLRVFGSPEVYIPSNPPQKK